MNNKLDKLKNTKSFKKIFRRLKVVNFDHQQKHSQNW